MPQQAGAVPRAAPGRQWAAGKGSALPGGGALNLWILFVLLWAVIPDVKGNRVKPLPPRAASQVQVCSRVCSHTVSSLNKNRKRLFSVCGLLVSLKGSPASVGTPTRGSRPSMPSQDTGAGLGAWAQHLLFSAYCPEPSPCLIPAPAQPYPSPRPFPSPFPAPALAPSLNLPQPRPAPEPKEKGQVGDVFRRA